MIDKIYNTVNNLLTLLIVMILPGFLQEIVFHPKFEGHESCLKMGVKGEICKILDNKWCTWYFYESMPLSVKNSKSFSDFLFNVSVMNLSTDREQKLK